MTPDWLGGGEVGCRSRGSGLKLFSSESVHLIFQSLLQSVGCEVSLGHGHPSPYHVTPPIIGIAGILTNALFKPSSL